MEYLHRTPEMAIAAHENVLLVGWLGAPDVECARALETASRTLARARGGGRIAHLNLVAKNARPTTFDDGARRIIVGLIRDRELGIVASATVFGGDGFVAATIRSVLSSLTMLSRSPVPIRLAGNAEQAEAMLRQELAAAEAHVPAPGSLVTALGALRRDAEAAGVSF